MKTLDDFIKPRKPWEVEGIEWREVRLGEVCIINPKKSEVRTLLEQNLNVSFIPMEYVDDSEGRIVKKDVKPINAVYKGYTYFKEGDVLFAKITPCMENGKSAIARDLTNGIGFGSTEFHVLRPNKGILSEFIFYFIRRKKFRNLAKLYFTGTVGHKRVPKEFLINTKIPLPFHNGKPDLETQKKIVEYIEANFSRIDNILEKKKKELEQLDELWESILEQAFKPKEGEEWREVRLGEVCQRRGENVIPVRNNYIYVGLEHINSGEIKLVRWEYSNKVKSTKYKFYPDDILYGKLRPYLDKAVISDKEGICSTDFIVITPIKDKVLPFYLIYFLHTKSFVSYSISMMKGVHLPRVSWTIIKRVKIPIPFRNGKPDIEKQKEIANYLDEVYERIKTLKEKIQKQINLLEEIKESILDEVFNGEGGGK